MKKIRVEATGCGSIFSVDVIESHSSPTSTATIECKDTSLDIGNYIEIKAGYYDGDFLRIFSGHVKMIEYNALQQTYTLTCADIMTRAIDYYFAPENPDQPFKRSNIAAEFLVRDILQEAGITTYDYQETNFILGVNGTEAEIKLITAYDAAKSIADLIAWHLWADRNGVVHFRNRKPYVMYGNSGQPGDVADTDLPITIDKNNGNVLSLSKSISEKNLRNKVVVWGARGITAVASAGSPYLPPGFYKTVLFSHPMLATQELAQKTADYNLALLNRLTESVRITVEGDPNLQTRKTINVTDSDINNRFYIFSCRHSISAGSGYITELELTR